MTRITWTDSDPVARTATTTDSAGTFNTGNIAPGQSFSSTFDRTGTFPNTCEYDPSTYGTITVQ